MLVYMKHTQADQYLNSHSIYGNSLSIKEKTETKEILVNVGKVHFCEMHRAS